MKATTTNYGEQDRSQFSRDLLMRLNNKKRLRITQRDFLLANRKAAREEENLAHGKPISFRSHLQVSKKKYNRKQLKKAITQTDDGFCHSVDEHKTDAQASAF